MNQLVYSVSNLTATVDEIALLTTPLYPLYLSGITTPETGEWAREVERGKISNYCLFAEFQRSGSRFISDGFKERR